MCECDQILIWRQGLLILELEQHLVLPPLVNRIEDLDYHWDEYEEIGKCGEYILVCNEGDNANDGKCGHE